jgi:transcription termination factor NusB
MFKSTTIITVVLLVILGQAAIAQDLGQLIEGDKAAINHAVKNYVRALKCENIGVVESAIINLMALKYYYPDNDYSSVVEQLELLEDDGRTKSIRFTAYIVKNYFNYPDRFAWIDELNKDKDKFFFASISEKIHEQVDE